MLEHLAVGRVVDVQHRGLVFESEADRGCQTLVDALPLNRAEQVARLLVKDLLHQRSYICVVVVKGVAVDAAAADDLPDGDLVERLAVEQLHKGCFDRVLCFVCHSLTSLFERKSYSQ